MKGLVWGISGKTTVNATSFENRRFSNFDKEIENWYLRPGHLQTVIYPPTCYDYIMNSSPSRLYSCLKRTVFCEEQASATKIEAQADIRRRFCRASKRAKEAEP